MFNAAVHNRPWQAHWQSKTSPVHQWPPMPAAQLKSSACHAGQLADVLDAPGRGQQARDISDLPEPGTPHSLGGASLGGASLAVQPGSPRSIEGLEASLQAVAAAKAPSDAGTPARVSFS